MITQIKFLVPWLKAHIKSDRGASLVEYALLVALIAVVCIAAIGLLGGKASDTFTDVGDKMSGVVENGED